MLKSARSTRLSTQNPCQRGRQAGPSGSTGPLASHLGPSPATAAGPHGSATQWQGRCSAGRCSPAASPSMAREGCQRAQRAEPHRLAQRRWPDGVGVHVATAACSPERKEAPCSALTSTTAASGERKRWRSTRRNCRRRESWNGAVVRELDVGGARRRARQLGRGCCCCGARGREAGEVEWQSGVACARSDRFEGGDAGQASFGRGPGS